MASGLPRAKWNNADVVGADVDLAAVAAWYAARDVPWGLRVPLELDVELGSPVFVKRCLVVTPDAFHARAATATVRRVRTGEVDALAAADARLLGGELDEARAWVELELGARGFAHWLAYDGSDVVGLATTVFTNADAGPAVHLAGVAGMTRSALEALVAAAVRDAFATIATFVHANPDGEVAEVLLAAGAVEVPGFRVRVVRPDRGG